MQSSFKNTKTPKSTYSEHDSSAIKHAKFENLTFVEPLGNGEMNHNLGGNAFRETERILTFDKGYPHKS